MRNRCLCECVVRSLLRWLPRHRLVQPPASSLGRRKPGTPLRPGILGTRGLWSNDYVTCLQEYTPLYNILPAPLSQVWPCSRQRVRSRLQHRRRPHHGAGHGVPWWGAHRREAHGEGGGASAEGNRRCLPVTPVQEPRACVRGRVPAAFVIFRKFLSCGSLRCCVMSQPLDGSPTEESRAEPNVFR